MLARAASSACRRWPCLLIGVLILSSVLFAGLWLGSASADEGASTSPDAVSSSVSNVPTARADAVYLEDSVCTCSPDYVDMPGMSETFKLGGTSNQPVMVLFQAGYQSFAQGEPIDAQVFSRLVIDGVVQGAGLRTATVHGTHGFNFVSAPLSPGTHTVTIQWRDNGVGPVHASHRSLIVLHK